MSNGGSGIKLGQIFGRLDDALRELERLTAQGRRIGEAIKSYGGWGVFALVVALVFALAGLGLSIYWATLDAYGIAGSVLAFLASGALLVTTIGALVTMAKVLGIGGQLADGNLIGGGLGALAAVGPALKWTRALLVAMIVSGALYLVAGILAILADATAGGVWTIIEGVLFAGAGIAGLYIFRWALRKALDDPRIPAIIKQLIEG